jgi:DNA-binding MarR family transcriptional regulator
MMDRGPAGAAGGVTGQLPVLSYMLGRLSVALGHAITQELEAIGVPRAEYSALAALRMRSGLSNAQLARRCLITPQSMSEVVAALERKDLIRRWNDPDHARILRAEMTPQAWPILAACDAATMDLEAQIQAALSPEDRETLLGGVTECVRALGAWVDATAPVSGAVR